MQNLVIRGARAHNLKNVSTTLPRDSFIVFTGVSGSGKSTLAFDTIYAEGQRRYVESLSAYARQFLGLMDKPDVDSIEGLSPAISIDQKTTSHNPRSTVGTVTEIHDYLRLLFARAGTPHCPICGRVIERQSATEIVDRMLEKFSEQRALIIAPLVRGRKGEYKRLFEGLKKEGFARVRVDGEVQTLDEALKLSLEKYEKHDIDIVVDRLKVSSEDRSRMAESVELALQKGEGLMRVFLPDKNQEELFSERFACPEHGTVLEELEPRAFSFNSPYGACPHCTGLGSRSEFDPELLFPTTSFRSVRARLRRGVRGGATNRRCFTGTSLKALAEHLDFDLHTPWRELPNKVQQTLLKRQQRPD